MTSIKSIILSDGARFEKTTINGVTVSLKVDGERAILSMPVGYVNDDPSLGYDDESQAVFDAAQAELEASGFSFHDSGEDDGNCEYHIFFRELEEEVEIVVDYEVNAVRWWDAARESAAAGTAPAAIVGLLAVGGPDSVTVTRSVADEVEAWAAALPGGEDAPLLFV
jgi:hypothetical protein